MMDIVRQNNEFKELIIEQNKIILDIVKANENKTCVTNTTHNYHTNSFNLNVFLHEQCKGALNIMEFVNSLSVQLNELETVGRQGYVEGISQIVVRGLKELDVHMRPIHCSDLKRETLYVKDNDEWERDVDMTKMKSALRQVASKNVKQILFWRKSNPSCDNSQTKKHDEYMKIMNESMGGTTAEKEEQNMNKIIRKITKQVVIEKNPGDALATSTT